MAIKASSTTTLVRVSDGADGVTAWTTTVAPVAPNYTFTKTNLNGAAGHTPKVGDLIFYSYYRYRISTVAATTVLTTDRVSIRGAAGSDGQSAYEAAVAGGYQGTQTEFYTELGLMGDLPEAFSTLQTHDGKLTSHGAIFTKLDITVDQYGNVVGADKKYSELTATQLEIGQHLEYGGINLIENAIFGSREVPDPSYWHGPDTVGYVNSRFENMTVAQVNALLGDKTITQVNTLDW